jgi:hypothetical protein
VERQLFRSPILNIPPPYPGKEKPRSHRCFKPGDLIYFVKENEIGILTERFDLYSKRGVPSEYPSWSWRLTLAPGKTLPALCNSSYGASEINLYNAMGHNIRWVPAK